MVIIIAIGSGINLFEYIGKQQPNWWIWCTSNKIYACLVVFFGSNMFEGMLISTGAFELYLNGKHIKHIILQEYFILLILLIYRYSCLVKIGNWKDSSTC